MPREAPRSSRKKLEVNTKNLTAAVRKKTSAEDDRPSSESFGAIAITMLVLVCFLISLGDIIVVIFYIKQGFINMFFPSPRIALDLAEPVDSLST